MNVHYPSSPGFKAVSTETSALAARRVSGRAGNLLKGVLAVLRHSDCTADEVARLMGESVLAIRPRLSELHAMNLIVPTPHRRMNESGHSAVVWQCHNPKQSELI